MAHAEALSAAKGQSNQRAALTLPDIAAGQGDDWTAVEIETGESDAVANIRKDLDAGAVQVICAATTSQALARLERLVGQAGLDAEPRTKLALASRLCEDLKHRAELT